MEEGKGFVIPSGPARARAPRGRGRGRGRGDTQMPPPSFLNPDEEGYPPPSIMMPASRGEGGSTEIKLTNDDATVSKLSAVDIGYYEDNFLHYFVKMRERRPPLINRGYFARVAAIRQLMQGFLDAQPSSFEDSVPQSKLSKQIVIFGAGFDTTFFQLRSKGVLGDEVNYFEFDFPSVVRNKMKVILNHPEMVSLAFGSNTEGKADEDKAILHGSNYHLMGVDLRDLEGLEKAAQEAGLDKSKPTLFISECVLIYVEPDESAAVIRWAASFAAGIFLTYEMIRPDDPFGKMMVKNLESRGVLLLGLRARPDVKDQKEGYLGLGWERVDVLDMNEIYDHFIDSSLVHRAARLEIFDEMEEWRLIQGHYCIVCAVKEGSAFSGLWNNVRLVKRQ